MVAPAVPEFGRVLTLNFARAYLFRAAEALDRGDLIAAGCLLREAIRRQCWAECEWNGCLPQNVSLRTPPVTLLRALARASKCEANFSWVKEMIETANAAAHCIPVKRSELRFAIETFHGVIDDCSSLQPANIAGKLTADSPHENADYGLDDCDDDDRRKADWWKPEGWNPQL